MIKSLLSVIALFAVSLPATAAVVSLHGTGPHSFTIFTGLNSIGAIAVFVGLVAIACALFFRFQKAKR